MDSDKIMRLSSETAENVKWSIETAGDEFEDDYGYISWSKASKYLNKVGDILDSNIPCYKERGLYYEAFDIALTAMVSMCKKDMDDSGGEILAIGEIVAGIWKDILEHADLDTRKKIFNRLGRLENGLRTHDFVRDTVSDFRHLEFKDDYFLKKLEKEAMEILDKGKGKTFDSLIRFEKAATTMAGVLCSSNRPLDEIDSFLARYFDIDDVKLIVYRYYLSCNLVDKAVSLANNILASVYLRCNKAIIIKEVYELLIRNNRDENALEFLIANTVECHRAESLEPFLIIKGKVSDERWRILREKIFSGYEELGYEMMIEEGCLDRLFEKAMKLDYTEYGNQELFKSLKKKLRKSDSHRTAILHLYVLDSKMKKTNKRSYYQWIIEELCNMKKDYPEEIGQITALAGKWRESYPLRKAMLEELDLYGF